MKNIGILGSTGSIGTQALEIVRKNHDLKVCALAAGGNVLKMEEQVREFKPRLAVMWTEEAARELRARVADTGTKVAQGMEGLLEIAVREDLEVLVTAVVGMIGIKPTIAAIEAGKTIALANKETLVTAGHLIMPLAKEYGVRYLNSDFKKRDGYKRSVALSEEYGLYRQYYCGCEFSKKQRDTEIAQKEKAGITGKGRIL